MMSKRKEPALGRDAKGAELWTGGLYRMAGAAGEVLTHMGWQGTEVALAIQQ